MARANRSRLPSFKGLAFETHDIGGQLDASGQYTLPFQREFPLSIRLFHYRAGRFTQGVTWHEQLEAFCPVTGVIDVQMGEHLIHLEAGDVLVMQNLKIHHVVDRPSLDCRAVVVSFLPELVYTLGSSSHDFAFLLPFYDRAGDRPLVLRRTERDAPAAREALVQLTAERRLR